MKALDIDLSRLLAATTLRNVLGTRNLGDILSERESIAQEMQVGGGVGDGLVDKLLNDFI